MSGRRAKQQRKDYERMIRVLDFNKDTTTPERTFELLWTGWCVGGLMLSRENKDARASGRLEGTTTRKFKQISVAAPTELDTNHRVLRRNEDGTYPTLKLSQPEFDVLVKFTDVTSVWNTAVMDEVVEMWDWRDAAEKQTE